MLEPPARPALLDAVAALPVASARLLAARALASRREWKAVLPASALPALLHRLAATHAVVLTEEGRAAARYVTRYWDTPDLRCFHDHRRGRARRAKVRVRDYLDRRLSRLEVKVRHPGGRATKPFALRPIGHVLAADDLAFVAQSAPIDLPLLRPSLTVQFARITLVGTDREERITIDQGLTWSRGGATVSHPHLAVVELKSRSKAAAAPSLRALAAVGHHPAAFSKYAAGIVLCTPEVRHHRLRPMLRRLARAAP